MDAIGAALPSQVFEDVLELRMVFQQCGEFVHDHHQGGKRRDVGAAFTCLEVGGGVFEPARRGAQPLPAFHLAAQHVLQAVDVVVLADVGEHLNGVVKVLETGEGAVAFVVDQDEVDFIGSVANGSAQQQVRHEATFARAGVAEDQPMAAHAALGIFLHVHADRRPGPVPSDRHIHPIGIAITVTGPQSGSHGAGVGHVVQRLPRALLAAAIDAHISLTRSGRPPARHPAGDSAGVAVTDGVYRRHPILQRIIRAHAAAAGTPVGGHLHPRAQRGLQIRFIDPAAADHGDRFAALPASGDGAHPVSDDDQPRLVPGVGGIGGEPAAAGDEFLEASPGLRRRVHHPFAAQLVCAEGVLVVRKPLDPVPLFRALSDDGDGHQGRRMKNRQLQQHRPNHPIEVPVTEELHRRVRLEVDLDRHVVNGAVRAEKPLRGDVLHRLEVGFRSGGGHGQAAAELLIVESHPRGQEIGAVAFGIRQLPLAGTADHGRQYRRGGGGMRQVLVLAFSPFVHGAAQPADHLGVFAAFSVDLGGFFPAAAEVAAHHPARGHQKHQREHQHERRDFPDAGGQEDADHADDGHHHQQRQDLLEFPDRHHIGHLAGRGHCGLDHREFRCRFRLPRRDPGTCGHRFPSVISAAAGFPGRVSWAMRASRLDSSGPAASPANTGHGAGNGEDNPSDAGAEEDPSVIDTNP